MGPGASKGNPKCVKGHGNAVAIALAGLAVVMAASGTAYAVTATTVNIADPTSPARVATVDTSGRLSTSTATSDINTLNSVSDYSYFTAMTSPTTATLAITSITYSNQLRNAGIAHASFELELERVVADASGVCEHTGSYIDLAPYISVAPGQTVVQNFASPLIVKAPAGGAKYCLSAYLLPGDGTVPNGATFPQIQLTAYVAGGKYTTAAATPAKASGGAATGAKATH